MSAAFPTERPRYASSSLSILPSSNERQPGKYLGVSSSLPEPTSRITKLGHSGTEHLLAGIVLDLLDTILLDDLDRHTFEVDR
jgi:hypothetical protein